MSISDLFKPSKVQPKSVKPHNRSRKTPEDRLKDFANKEIIQQMQECPEKRAIYINNIFGKTIIPIEDTKSKLDRQVEETVGELLLEKVKTDDDLKNRLVDAYADRLIMGTIEPEIRSRRRRGRDEEYQYIPDSPLSSAISSVQELEQLREVLGANKGGGWKEFITPELIAAGFNALLSLKGGHEVRQLETPRRRYQIETPQGLVDVSQEQYIAYLEEQSRKQLTDGAVLKEAVVHKIDSNDINNDMRDNSEDENKEKVNLQIAVWEPYLDKEPKEFVDFLLDSAEKGDESSILSIQFFQLMTAKEFIDAINRFKDKPDVKDIIAKLNTKVEWLNDVIELIKLAAEAANAGVNSTPSIDKKQDMSDTKKTLQQNTSDNTVV